MKEHLQPEVALLNEALELAESERRSFLDRSCAGDSELRSRVEALLEAHGRLDGFMDTPPSIALQRPNGSISDTPSAGSTGPGDHVGPYRILEQLGEGGCGVVFLAEQHEPLRRRVALKIIKLGMDTKAVMARFDAERQALAMMDHPNIARVLDAGSTESGRPYFVMEWVRGVSITTYSNKHELGLLERLELFCCVCRAIQHAHQKGVIHRDVKPSNVLVSTSDRGHEVKVIDFGIAKATQGRLTNQTLFTATEFFMGTPAYMSPEQTFAMRDDVDTRTDIYSLGILLYELLTGETPFHPETLARGGLDEMRRIICEVEPVRPSQRLTGGSKGSPPGFDIDQDLDWIVMKCLEKDRARRYETVNGLVADVERFMAHEPVQARPPHAWYRLQKMARRNKWAFILSGTALIVLLTLVVGSMVAVWHVTGARKAEQEERQRAEIANRKLLETVRLLELERAESTLEEDPSLAIAQLTAILRQDPSHYAAANRLVSALIHRNWAVPVREPMRHLGPVTWVEFSPDGKIILSASKDGTVTLRDARGTNIICIFKHRSEILEARFSPDGTRIATASADGTARLWKTIDGKPLSPSLKHDGKVVSIDFSPDGQWLLTASEDRTARIWDAQSGALKQSFVGHSRPIVSAQFSPDGKTVATANVTGGLRTWSVETGQPLVQMNHRSPIHSIDFSPDGRRLLVGYEHGNARVWDVVRGTDAVPQLIHSTERIPVWHVGFSPDGRLMFTGGEDGTAQIWDSETGRPVGPRLKHSAGVVHASFSHDGQKLVTASSDNTSRVWDVLSGRPITQPLRDHERILHAVFSPDSTLVATASSAWHLKIWDIQPRRDAGWQFKGEDDLRTVSFTQNGSLLLSAGRDHQVRVWDILHGKQVGNSLNMGDTVEQIAVHRDGHTFIPVTDTNILNAYNTLTGAQSVGPFVHSASVTACIFSPANDLWASACTDGTVRVWTLGQTNPIVLIAAHKGPILDLQFSHDGRWLATASEDWSARVWNAQTGQPRSDYLPHLDHVRSVAFSPDDRLVATASTDNTTSIWETSSGKRMGTPFRHSRTVEKVAFSPDGRHVATASLDRTVRVWDVSTGSPVTPALIHETPVVHVEYSADGQRIFSASRDAARLWDARTGRPISEWLRVSGGIMKAQVDPTGDGFAVAARRAYLWRCPKAPLPMPESFIQAAEEWGGLRLDARGYPELVTWKTAATPVDNGPFPFPPKAGESFYPAVTSWLHTPPEARGPSPF